MRATGILSRFSTTQSIWANKMPKVRVLHQYYWFFIVALHISYTMCFEGRSKMMESIDINGMFAQYFGEMIVDVIRFYDVLFIVLYSFVAWVSPARGTIVAFNNETFLYQNQYQR